MQDYPTGFTALFDAMISANRSQQLLTLLQDGHFLDSQTASEHGHLCCAMFNAQIHDNVTHVIMSRLVIHHDAFCLAERDLLLGARCLMHLTL